MPVELGNIELKKIHLIETVEEANIVYHMVPGMEGSASQDLGRSSARIRINGIFYGRTAKEELEKLRSLYTKREPVDFVADIVNSSYVGKVVLDRFDVTESAEDPGQLSYSLVVAEYVEPPAPAAGGDLADSSIKLDARSMLDMASLPDLLSLGSVPEITNPFEPLQRSLEPVQGAVTNLSASLEGLRMLLVK